MTRRLSTLLLALLCVAALAPAAANAKRGQTVYFEAPELRDPAQRQAALDDLDELGVRALRVVLYWRDVAPAAEGGAYDFSRYDGVVDAAEARGWEVLLTLSGPIPAWASKSGTSQLADPVPAKFEAFATLAAQRYADRVERFAIWNEPNHPDFLLPQYRKGKPVSGTLYRKLAVAGLAGLQTGGVGSERVLLGETAPIGTGKVVAPLTFLRQTLCLDSRYRKRASCARLTAAGWAHHPYTRAEGPFARPESANAVTIGVLSRLVSALDKAGRAKALPSRLPVFITEFGVQSEPDELAGVTLLRQAEYRSISERLAYENPRVATFSQYLLKDDKPDLGAPRIARYPGFESGLRTFDGKRKPSFDGFRLPMAALRTSKGVSLWGVVRNNGAGREVRITFSDGNGYKPLRTVKTDARGAWRMTTGFRRGRRFRAEVTTAGGRVVRGAPSRAYARR